MRKEVRWLRRLLEPLGGHLAVDNVRFGHNATARSSHG